MPARVIEESPHNDDLRDRFWAAYLATTTRPAVDAFLAALFGRKDG